MKKVPIPALAVGLLLVVILVGHAVTFTVRFSEVAFRVRFGEAQEIIQDAGLKLRWPWPIETVIKYDKRPKLTDTTESELKTRDGKNVIVGCYAIWRIEDPRKFFIKVVTEDDAIKKVRVRINDVRSAVIGQHDMSDFLNLVEAELEETYDAIEQEMLDAAAPGLMTDFGIALARVGIRRISLPEQVTETVFQQMIQERERVATKDREEGKARAEAIKARAESAQRAILAFAGAKAGEIESEGIRAATRELEAVKDSGFFIWLRQMDALEASLAQRTTIFFDTSEQLFSLFATPPSAPAAAGDADASAALIGYELVCGECGARLRMDKRPKSNRAYQCPHCEKTALRADLSAASAPPSDAN